MPAASIITTYLTAPFNRKVDFHNAYKLAMENAGFPFTNVDEYDITDTRHQSTTGSAIFNAGGAGSVRGFVKQLTYNATANGIMGMGCFTRTVYNSSVGGSQSTVTPYNDLGFIAGGFVYTDGWNGVTKEPTSAALGKVIGGYNYNQPFSSSLSNGDTFVTGGSYGVTGHPFWRNPSTSYIKQCVLNYLNPVKFVSINHPEIRGVFIHQMDKSPYFIGICKPGNPPSWLNENTLPYGFMASDSSFLMYQSFSNTANPFNASPAASVHLTVPGMSLSFMGNSPISHQPGIGFNNSSIAVLNPVNPGNNNKRDLIPGPHLFSNSGGAGVASGKWLFGQYSGDIVFTLSHGLQLFDRIIVSPGTEEYMVLTTPEYTNFGDGNNPVSTRAAPDSYYYGYYSIALRTV